MPWGELGVEVVLECSGQFRTREALDAYFRAGRPQGHRRRAGQAGSAQRRRRASTTTSTTPRATTSLTAASCTTNCLAPVVKVIHEGIGIRHGVDHDAARHDQHADAGRRAAQGPAPGARGHALADPDDDRLGDGDRADLPGARRAARRPRGPRPAAQRLAHRLRLRGRPADDGRGGQRPPRGRRRRAARGHPRLRAAAARLGRLQGRSALGDRGRALDDGHRRDAGQDPGLVRQRVGLRQPHGGARPHGRRRASSDGAAR